MKVHEEKKNYCLMIVDGTVREKVPLTADIVKVSWKHAVVSIFNLKASTGGGGEGVIWG